MSFLRLQLANWRQFSLVDIEFHPNLTIITGANGAGKSSLLNILGQHIGASRPYLGVPMTVDGKRTFVSSLFSIPSRILDWFKPKQDPNWSTIGNIYYSNGQETVLQVPTQGQQSYGVHIPTQQPVIGFHMPSHRNLPNYQQIPNIPFGGFIPQSAFGRLIGVAYQAFHGSSSSGSVLFQLKELLAAWAVFGEGNSTLGRDQSQKEAYDGFVDILGRLLPPDLGFTGLRVDAPDIVILTKSGDFLIDSLSGGLTAIIEVAALIYTRSLMDDVPEGRFVVTMDEPENHLHPAIQRTLLSSLVKAFPNVQFIVATHSPFIVTSSKDARVYALKYEDVVVSEEQWDQSASQHVPDEQLSPHQARRVQCIFLKSGQLSSSTTDILREVLGVPVTFPVWIETSLEAIVGNYRDRPFNERTIADFRRDIDAAGLSEMFPEALLNLGRTN